MVLHILVMHIVLVELCESSEYLGICCCFVKTFILKKMLNVYYFIHLDFLYKKKYFNQLLNDAFIAYHIIISHFH